MNNKNVIKVLPLEVINQISSGEIIQRPSSVLRELLENSIDANAKKIDIFIKNFGNELIQLVDDGIGMNIHDAKMSINKHATSKIRNINDLFNIHSKGFRGEALASISLVSQLEIKTKTKDSLLGIHLFIEKGKIKKEILINMINGTRISVKNLFYQNPINKNYLKSPEKEYKYIINEFYKIVLAHRNILYRFYHNGKMIFFFPKNSLINRIKDIFNVEINNFKTIFIKQNNITIDGFISIPNNLTIKNGNQLIWINKRNVKYNELHKKIIYSYKKILKRLKTISYFIFINLPVNLINFNIHPYKKEVKIQKEEEIGCLIQKEIKETLFYQYKIDNNINNFNINQEYKKKHKENVVQFENCMKDHLQLLNNVKYSKIENCKKYFIKWKKYISIKNILQINKKYIIFNPNNEDIILFDQHQIHKQILYNYFKEKKIFFIKITPVKIPLLKKEIIVLNYIKKNLIKLGFLFYFYRKNIYLYSIPNNVKIEIIIKILKSILKYNFVKNKYIQNNKIIIKHIVTSISIKHGDTLLPFQMKKLIEDLLNCKNITKDYKPAYLILNNIFIINIFFIVFF